MSADGAWELTRAISPRTTVRVAAVDAYGVAQNLYTSVRRLAHTAPAAPWAMYLASTTGHYRMLGFDFDVKSGDAAGDAARLSGLLSGASVEHVICASGPSGGRHVWAALSEPLEASAVKDIAHLVKALCPSLDLSPLTNPATGCLRPPGAPHRNGGASQLLHGDLSVLEAPTTTAAAVAGFVTALTAAVPRRGDAGSQRRGAIAHDAHGHPYLPGPKRLLPQFASVALSEQAALGDASSVLWRVLLGAVAAHWRLGDVAELVDRSPGLEHARSIRDRSTRTRRPARGPQSVQAVLARQWTKAVQHVAARDQQTGDDPTFEPRALDIERQVRGVQDRARAVGGRWLARGGPADRRVLDALCFLALQAVSASVEADIRRLALLAGVGRETARSALLRLAADGWIMRARMAEGPHAAHWLLVPPAALHRDSEESRSQADPRPAGTALRSALLHELGSRLNAGTHDVFTLSPGLGLLSGTIYGHLTQFAMSTLDIARRMGVSADTLLPSLMRLESAGLVQLVAGDWICRPDVLPFVAVRLQVAGRLKDRARRYMLERELWAWWQAEKVWMDAPRRNGASRRPRPGQGELVAVDETNVYGAHPRDANGRADYRRARQILVENPQLTDSSARKSHRREHSQRRAA